MIIAPLFFKNYDNNHCLQASILMCLNSLNVSMTFEEIDKLTDYDPDYYSWIIVGAKILQDKISGIQLLTTLDYNEFTKNGEDYLKKYWSPSQYQDQKEHSSSNFLDAQTATKEFLQNDGTFIHLSKKCTEGELSNFLKTNVIIMFVDWNQLYKPGLMESRGHFVVVFAKTTDSFIIHDSGLISTACGRRIKKTLLLNAGGSEMLLIPKGNSPIGKFIKRNEPCYCGSKKIFKKCHKPILDKRENLTIIDC